MFFYGGKFALYHTFPSLSDFSRVNGRISVPISEDGKTPSTTPTPGGETSPIDDYYEYEGVEPLNDAEAAFLSALTFCRVLIWLKCICSLFG
jgi:hypothetical protein